MNSRITDKYYPTPYTVQRIRKDNTLYGPIHGSWDGDETVCGKLTDHNWYVLTNAFDGETTCKRCLRGIPK